MTESGRQDEPGGTIPETARTPVAGEVDRDQATVMAPKLARAPQNGVDSAPLFSTPQPAIGYAQDESYRSTPFPPPSVGPRSQVPSFTPPSSQGPFSSRGAHSSGGPSRPPGSLRSRAFPVVGWDRYEPVEFIGEGGMGRVYKVFDPMLRRHIALKFIRDEDQNLIRRFFREAQAQARIDHEFVCKVYEVGEVEGLPYIAMQYIEGKSLKEAAQSMSLDQKVTVVRKVALALHAAHKLGIIHRDIKPSNIMVEQKEDGSYHPYVMDFGLAREMATAGESVAGVIEGTPSYMAPEQARGEGKQIDRRADVYSLGATLYQQLTQRPPFVGDSSLAILLAVEKEEPTPPRKLAPSIPEDLEIITLKCLEKEAGQRYESARALADDLERYLNGDPIKARKASLSYLALKKIRKHKAIFVVSCIGVLGVSVAAGVGIRARVLASEQAELSQQLGKDVKEMELLLRWAYGLPLHDVNREKARIRERMKEIEQRIERMGELGAGPGHYAIGRGHLALREPAKAREHLVKALGAGYGGPEVEGALGMALGDLYKKELDETHRIGDKATRDERRSVIERELLEPALLHLRNGGGEEVDSKAYVEGLIAFYKKSYGEALEKARLSEERALSTYEAKKLRGDVYSALGTEKKEQGQAELALADYDRAAESYEAARTIARSDAAVYEAECELWVQRMEIESNLGRSPKASFEKAEAACDSALAANPGSGAAHGKKAWALWQFGAYLSASLQDPSAVLLRAIEAGKLAEDLEPQNASVRDTIGNAYVDLGSYEMSQGKDPRPSFRLGAEHLAKAIELHPNFAWAYNDLGSVYRSVGEYELSRGIDPTDSLNKSISYRERAIELNPLYHYPYTNMGMAYAMKAHYELRVGGDPSESIKRSIAACERSLGVNKSYYMTHDILGVVYTMDAQHKRYMGADYEGSVRMALQWFTSELDVNPKSYYAHLGIAMANLLVAHDLVGRGSEAGVALAKAEAALHGMEKTGGEDIQIPLTHTKIYMLKARGAPGDSEEGRAASALREAEAAFEKALKAGSGVWEVFATGAELSFWRAREAHRGERPAADAVRRGLELAKDGLEISSNESVLLLWKGALLLLSSRIERGFDSENAAHEGKSLLERALRRNPFLERERKVVEAAIDSK